MKILRFREVKCVSNHKLLSKMQQWNLNAGLPVPERFLIISGGYMDLAPPALKSINCSGR